MANSDDLDTQAAVTRSMLGWGVVAGPFYVILGLVLAITRTGFDLTRHALSLLMLGDLGWLQRANLALTALMVVFAALGMLRAIRNGRGLAMGVLTIVYAAGLIGSAIFPPDPTGAFPPDAPSGEFTLSGILHLLFGAIGFAAITAAAFAHAAWSRPIGARGHAVVSAVLAIVVLGGFIAGAALSASAAGVALLWIAVLAQFTWLAIACAHIYTWSPHPLRSKRTADAPCTRTQGQH